MYIPSVYIYIYTYPSYPHIDPLSQYGSHIISITVTYNWAVTRVVAYIYI